MKKKLLSILLSLAMVVTMIPMMTGVAFAGTIQTVGDVLNTVEGGFPAYQGGYPENAWTADNGNKMALVTGNGELVIQYSGGSSSTSVNKAFKVTESGGNYVFTFDTETAIFNMQDGKLVSIDYTDTNPVSAHNNGVYTAPVAKATVTFNMNGHGTAIDPITVDVGSTVNAPAAPAEEGWDFEGWFTDEKCTAGNEYDFSTAVTADMTLHAKWVKKSTPTPAPTPDNTDKGVKTGDSSDIIFYGFTTLLALLGAGFVYGLRRKEEK